MHDRQRGGRRAAAEDCPVAGDAQAVDLCVRRTDALKLPRRHINQAQSPVALLVERANYLVSGREAIGRHAKDPLRHAEFCLHLTKRFRLAFIVAIEVPPSRAVGDEMQAAIGRPFRLEDGFACAAGDQMTLAERAVVVDFSKPKFCAVPRQVRMIPRQPRQLSAIRTETRRRVEIIALDDHRAAGVAVEVDACNRVDAVVIRCGVVFAHTDHAIAPLIDDAVSVTHLL